MMIRAYIALKSSAGEYLETSKTIQEIIAKMPGVVKVDLIFGRFDIMTEVEVKDVNELSRLVDQIKSVPNVASTETFIARS